MQKTRSNTFFSSDTLTNMNRAKNGGNGSFFERNQKRSPYVSGGAQVRRKETSMGFTLCAVLLLFLVYPVGLVMIWNHRVELAPGTKLILTLLAAVVFCLALVYAANIETNNPQLMKIQSALNGAFDWVYRVFGSAFKSIGSSR